MYDWVKIAIALFICINCCTNEQQAIDQTINAISQVPSVKQMTGRIEKRLNRAVEESTGLSTAYYGFTATALSQRKIDTRVLKNFSQRVGVGRLRPDITVDIDSGEFKGSIKYGFSW